MQSKGVLIMPNHFNFAAQAIVTQNQYYSGTDGYSIANQNQYPDLVNPNSGERELAPVNASVELLRNSYATSSDYGNMVKNQATLQREAADFTRLESNQLNSGVVYSSNLISQANYLSYSLNQNNVYPQNDRTSPP
jgi:hypothetical protein